MNNEVEYKGARFYKCALQVNPYNYKKNHQGGKKQDENAYNEQIFEQCRKNGISVLGLADHGNVENSTGLRTYLTEKKITVFPGFEIPSSENIHMVCLYSEKTTAAQLNQSLGQLMGENYSKLADDPTHSSSLSCEEMAKKILNDQKGFWYAAHLTSQKGLLRLSGAGDNYVHLWKKDDLVIAAQIPGSVEDLITGSTELSKYKQIIENRNRDYKRGKDIAIINAKDIIIPEVLSDPSASCLIKMTAANFQAFKDAFKDPKSRICLNHQTPKNPISFIESIRWSGAGLFEDQELAFSPNLNAIIGGRGTGKSTLVESIRFALDLQPRGDESKSVQSIQSNNLKNSQVELRVRSRSQNGESYTITRRFGEAPVVRNTTGEISRMTPRDILPQVELLGQNEILEIEKSEENKLALLNKFLPNIQELGNRIDEAKGRLVKNRSMIVEARKELDAIEQRVNREDKLKEVRDRFKQLGIEGKLKNSALLEREAQIERRMDDQFARTEDWIKRYTDIFDLNFLEDTNIEELPNKELIIEIRNSIEALKISSDNLIKQIGQELEETKAAYRSKRKDWKIEEDKIRDQLNQAIAQLPNQEGRSGKEIGAEYQKIIAELTALEGYKAEQQNQKRRIEALESERRSLLEEYHDTAFKRYETMEKAIQKLNKKNLQGKVKISLGHCKNIDDLKKFMKKLHGLGEAKIEWLDEVENIDTRKWSQWIKEKSTNQFKKEYTRYGVTDLTIDRLFAITFEQRLELEEIELKDTVSIKLNVAHENETANYVPMENLSIGQKCTAILNLLLIQKDDPLIIDQPEDHLDNAFIAERIVSELRNLKTERQFLFATHNANIPVFGDAELIVVLENRKSKAIFKNIGSIDNPDICEQATQILEGGRAAFDMRKEKYGF